MVVALIACVVLLRSPGEGELPPPPPAQVGGAAAKPVVPKFTRAPVAAVFDVPETPQPAVDSPPATTADDASTDRAPAPDATAGSDPSRATSVPSPGAATSTGGEPAPASCPPKTRPRHPMAYRSWKEAEERKVESQVLVPIARNAIVRVAAAAKAVVVGFVSVGVGKVVRVSSADADPPRSTFLAALFNATASFPSGTVLATSLEGSRPPWCFEGDAAAELRVVRRELARMGSRLFVVSKSMECEAKAEGAAPVVAPAGQSRAFRAAAAVLEEQTEVARPEVPGRAAAAAGATAEAPATPPPSTTTTAAPPTSTLAPTTTAVQETNPLVPILAAGEGRTESTAAAPAETRVSAGTTVAATKAAVDAGTTTTSTAAPSTGPPSPPPSTAPSPPTAAPAPTATMGVAEQEEAGIVFLDRRLRDEDAACVVVAVVAPMLDDEAAELGSKGRCAALATQTNGAGATGASQFARKRAQQVGRYQLRALDVARSLAGAGAAAAVFANVGNGDVRVITTFEAGNQRFGFSGVTKIYEAVAALPTGTMVLLWLETASPFCSGHKHWGSTVSELLAKYPTDLWIATMNPCIVNATAGTIGPREIPIPPFDVFNGDAYIDGLRKQGQTPVSKKLAVVRWRGASTGIPWLQSQRFRVLSHFRTMKEKRGADTARLIDVGVSRLARVTRAEVPLFEGEMSDEEIGKSQVQLDLDGDANSWRGGQWKLFVGAAVLRVESEFVQWYHRHMVNGTHVLVFDTPEQLAEAAVRLVRPPQSPDTVEMLETLAKGARETGERFHTLEALEAYTEARIRCAAQEYDPQLDWRIRR